MKSEKDLHKAVRLLNSYHAAIALFHEIRNTAQIGVSARVDGSHYTFVDVNDNTLKREVLRSTKLSHLEDSDITKSATIGIAQAAHKIILNELAALVFYYKDALAGLGITPDKPVEPLIVDLYTLGETPTPDTIAEE